MQTMTLKQNKCYIKYFLYVGTTSTIRDHHTKSHYDVPNLPKLAKLLTVQLIHQVKCRYSTLESRPFCVCSGQVTSDVVRQWVQGAGKPGLVGGVTAAAAAASYQTSSTKSTVMKSCVISPCCYVFALHAFVIHWHQWLCCVVRCCAFLQVSNMQLLMFFCLLGCRILDKSLQATLLVNSIV